MEINKDKPIQSHEVDLLHREKFVNSIVNLLHNNDDDDSLTIGLYGEWGSGKTSIINMICERLTSVDKEWSGYGEGEEYIKVIHFNPWLYSNASDLTRQFFTHLQSELEKNKAHKFATIVKKLGQYKEAMVPAVSLFFGPTAGIATKVGIDALTTYTSQTENRSLQTIKDELVEKLKELKQKIVIFIDDIDRLSDEEIVTTFKLVKLLADFPYVTYVLAFDYEVVAEALNRVQHNRGKEYMEKIIQVPIAIPIAREFDVKEVFENRVERILGTDKFNRIKKDLRWKALFSEGIIRFLHTIRDVNRYCNLVRIRYLMLKDNINCIDLLGICCLQVFENTIYQRLPFHKDLLCRTNRIFSDKLYSDKTIKNIVKKKYDNLISLAQNRELVVNILMLLFPDFHRYIKENVRYSHMSKEEVVLNYNICDVRNFDRYFIYDLSDTDIQRQHLMQLIYTFSENSIIEEIDRQFQNGSLEQMVEEFEILIKEDCVNPLPEDRIKYLVTILFKQTYRLVKNNFSSYGQLYRSIFYLMIALIGKIVDDEARFNFIKGIFSNNHIHIFVLTMFLDLYRELEKYWDCEIYFKHLTIISEEELRKLEEIYMQRAYDELHSGNFVGDNYGIGFIALMMKLRPECGERIKSYLINDDFCFIKLIGYALDEGDYFGNENRYKEEVYESENSRYVVYGDPYSYSEYAIMEKKLKPLIPIDEVYRRILVVVESDEFKRVSLRDQKNVIAFLLYVEQYSAYDLDLVVVNEDTIDKKLREILKEKQIDQ